MKHLQSNYMCFLFSPSFTRSVLPPSDPSSELVVVVGWGGVGGINRDDDETAWRETNTWEGARCVLTAGMSATLWVIKRDTPTAHTPSLELES